MERQLDKLSRPHRPGAAARRPACPEQRARDLHPVSDRGAGPARAHRHLHRASGHFERPRAALQTPSEIEALRQSLLAPIAGLALAFGTSLSGVATSLILGLASTLTRREELRLHQRIAGLCPGPQSRRHAPDHGARRPRRTRGGAAQAPGRIPGGRGVIVPTHTKETTTDVVAVGFFSTPRKRPLGRPTGGNCRMPLGERGVPRRLSQRSFTAISMCRWRPDRTPVVQAMTACFNAVNGLVARFTVPPGQGSGAKSQRTLPGRRVGAARSGRDADQWQRTRRPAGSARRASSLDGC